MNVGGQGVDAWAAQLRHDVKARGRGHAWTISFVPIAALALPLCTMLTVPVQGPDEGLLLVHPMSVMDGEVPNRDFATVYGPMTYWVLAAAFGICGPSLEVERSVGVAYRVILAVALVVMLRRTLPPSALSVVGASSLLIGLRTPPLAYAYSGATASLAVGLATLTTSRPVVRAFGGFAVGLTTAFRPEMGVLAVAALPLTRGHSKRPVLAGWLLGLIPMVVHVGVTHGQVLGDVVLRRAGINAQPGPPSPVLASVLGLLALAAVTLYGLGRARHDAALRAAALTSLLVLPVAVQRIDLAHVVAASTIGAAVALGALWGCFPSLGRWPLAAVPFIGTIALALVLGVPALNRSAPTVEHHGRSIRVAAAQATELERLLARVDQVARPGDAVFVGARDMSGPVLTSNWLYHLWPEYRHPFRFVEFLPGVTERRGSGLVDDLRKADVLVLEDLGEHSGGMTPYIPRGSDEANREVSSSFCLVARVGAFDVLARPPRCLAGAP